MTLLFAETTTIHYPLSGGAMPYSVPYRRMILSARSCLGDSGEAVRQRIATYRTAPADRNEALLVGAGFNSEIGDWCNMQALISLAFRQAETDGGMGASFLLLVCWP